MDSIITVTLEVAGGVKHFGFDQAGSHLAAGSGKKGIGHAAADQNSIHFLEELFDYGDLVADLGAAENGDEGTFGLLERLAEVGQLLLHQETGYGGQMGGHTGGACMGPVGAAESVVDEEVAEAGEGCAQRSIVAGFTGVEACVFEEQELP